MLFLLIIFFVIFLQNQDVVASWDLEVRLGFAGHRDKLEKRRDLVVAALNRDSNTRVLLPPAHTINEYFSRKIPRVDKNIRAAVAELLSRDSFNCVEVERAIGSCFCGDFEMYNDINPNKEVCFAVAKELIQNYATLPAPFSKKYQYR